MNSRERRESLDAMEAMIRQSLQARTGSKVPGANVRRSLLQRAGRQRRRLDWRLPTNVGNASEEGQVWLPVTVSPHQHVLYIEALFGPRLSWLSFNQLMR